MDARNAKKTHEEITEKRPIKGKSTNRRKSGQFRHWKSL